MSGLLESVLVLVWSKNNKESKMFGQRTIIIIVAYIHFPYNRNQFVHELDNALEPLANFDVFFKFWQAILVLKFYKVKT